MESIQDDPGEMMVTGDTDAARREAAPSTSTGQLSVVSDTENPMQISPGSTVAGQQKFMDNIDKNTIPQVETCSSSSTEVSIVNNMICQDNRGSITGSQFKECNIGTVNIVNNTIAVPATQKTEDTGVNNDMVIREYLDQWQRKVYKKVNRMTPPTWNSRYDIDLADVFTDLELLKGKRDGRASETTTLQDVLYLVQSQMACKVFVEGKGGMGKSTLLKHLAYCWANKRDDPFPGKLLFFVNLRDLNKDEDVLDVIVRQLNIRDFCRTTKLNKDLIVDFLMEHDGEIVLLLDGYDEVEASAEDPVSLFERKTFENSQVILASRPENVDKIVNTCDVHVKVEGFNPGKIKCYIKKHFESIKMPELGESLIKELHLDLKNEHKWGGRHAEAFEMCRSPMLLLKICTIWKENQSIPVDMSMLFKEIFRCILNQFINRSGADKPISRFEDTPEKYVKAMLTLGKCMFKALQNNRLSVDRNDMEGDEETVNLAIRLGYVYKEEAIVEDDFREIFNTPHKLISESLVGFYLSKESQCFSNDEGDILRSNQYLHMSRVFAIGFLGAEAGEFLKQWITNSVTCYCPLARYFQYVKKEYEEQVLQVLDKYICILSPDVKPHLEDLCTSVTEFLQHVQRVEVKKDEHLILLLRKIYQYLLTSNDFKTAVQSWAKSVSNNAPSRDFGRILAHILFVMDFHQHLVEYVDVYGHQDVIQGLKVEFEKFNFTYNMDYFTFYSINLSASALIHVLHYAPQLSSLTVRKCGISGQVINEMITAFTETGVLTLEDLDLSENDLSDVDMASIASLLQIAPKLRINMYKCCLSGIKVRDLLTECKKRGVEELRFPNIVDDNGLVAIQTEDLQTHGKSDIKYLDNLENDLSDIDGTSLACLLQIMSSIHGYALKWNKCKLTCKNLQDLILECNEHKVLSNLTALDISGIDLSTVSGTNLAKLLMVFPKLNTLLLNSCRLSGNIMKDLLNEIERIGVVFKGNINLCGNDLSDIDGASLAKLLKIIDNDCNVCRTWLMWRHLVDGKICNDYNLTTVNFCDFIVECNLSHISFNWTEIFLCYFNLSSVSGSTLASLFKICPKLTTLDMRWCSLTGKIVRDFLNGCNMNGVVLKQNMIHLNGNNLSDIDGATLAQLLSIIDINGNISSICQEFGLTICQEFGLTPSKFHDIILGCQRLGVVFNWTTLHLNDINLSAISGTLLASLFKICPKVKLFDMRCCNLSGTIITDFLLECYKEGAVLTQSMLALDGNDLSNIDGTSLAKLLQITGEVPWNAFNLSAENVRSFINEYCEDGIELVNTFVNVSRINLSSLSGTTLACLLKIYPKLDHIDMRFCSLSGGLIKELLDEFERRGVELKQSMLYLEGNDLSDIDGTSLAKLLKSETQCKWSDYKLNAGNLQDLIQECEKCKSKLPFTHLYLCGINLSTISGATLTYLIKISPNLKLLDMGSCSLSGALIGDLLDECEKRGVELKPNMLQLEGNDLSCIDTVSLTKLLDTIYIGDYDCFKWTRYNLSADTLHDFIQISLQSDITFGCSRIDLSGLDLAVFTGENLFSFFVIFPDLIELDMKECQLSGNLMSVIVKTCSEKGIITKVSTLKFSKADLSRLNGRLVNSMTNIFPRLNILQMNNCRLSSDVFKHIAKMCPSTGVVLPLTGLDVSENDLSDLNGESVVSLSRISPKLEYLNVSSCNISSQILKDVADGFSGKSTLGFTGLDLSNNDLHDLSAELLFYILRTSPKLEKLRMSNCRWTGEKFHGLVMKCLCGQPSEKCELCELDLSYNDLSTFEESSLNMIFSAFPCLHGLNLVSCQLTMEAYLGLQIFWPTKPGCKYFYF